MPLTSILSSLQLAQHEHYAIPLFDVLDSQSVDGVLLALETHQAPGIIGIYGPTFDQPTGAALATYVQTRARSASVPISLMLDHGTSFEQCMRAITAGFTDVMFDGSQLPLNENITITRIVTRAAHAVGVGVEAELGHVGRGSEYQTYGAQRKGFTEPNAAAIFASETHVDILAVAIGTAHGFYQGEPQLDFELLQTIRKKVNIPLALHGGSGCTEDQFRRAIKGGIAKINVATDLFQRASQRILDYGVDEHPTYWALSKTITDAFAERAGYYIRLFDAAGKAQRPG